jgi:hypothetical protein
MCEKDWGDFSWILWLTQLHYLSSKKKGGKKGAQKWYEKTVGVYNPNH